jgi:hypothetical protein
MPSSVVVIVVVPTPSPIVVVIVIAPIASILVVAQDVEAVVAVAE